MTPEEMFQKSHPLIEKIMKLVAEIEGENLKLFVMPKDIEKLIRFSSSILFSVVSSWIFGCYRELYVSFPESTNLNVEKTRKLIEDIHQFYINAAHEAINLAFQDLHDLLGERINSEMKH